MNKDTGGGSGVTIRQGRRSDVDAILAFIDRTYGRSASHVSKRWPWQFLDNPMHQEETIPVFVAVDGDQIVGYTSAVPVELKVGSTVHYAEWSCQMMVDRTYRGQGLGLGLTKAHADHAPIFMAVRMAPSTRYIEGKIGCVSFEPLWIYVRFSSVTRRAVFDYLMAKTARRPRLRQTAQFLCRVLQADAVIAGALNGYRGVRQGLRKFPKTSGIEIREITRFDEEVDALWERIKEQYGVIAKRDHTFLNWKAFEHPYLRYRGFEARRDGTLVGYCILRMSEDEEPSVGHIIDLFCGRDDGETLNSLIQHALVIFGKERAITQCETTIPEYEQALRRHGFHRVNSIVPNYRCLDPEMNRELEQRRTEWFITRIDQDLDQLRPTWSAGMNL